MEASRIAPGKREDLGLVNHTIAQVLGAATGGRPPNIFTTLGRHRSLFRRWLRFAGALMPGGMLPRDESELLILRVAHNSGSDYEWSHHERIGKLSGLTSEEIARVRAGPDAEGWSERRRLLLRAADDLHGETRTISDEVWNGLRPLMDDTELIELCMLIGHYEMLAMTLNSLGVEPDREPIGAQALPARAIQALARRRQGAGS